ncbi:hypothetical protein [Falsiphaeobacter marinintestinus]|nr:hypothetical protein [Phaeobacter marinintestinus]
MIETCVIAVLALTIALYVQARWAARSIRRKRGTSGNLVRSLT